MKITDLLKDFLVRGISFFYRLPAFIRPLDALGRLPSLRLRRGQNTVEFLLLLAIVASVAMTMGILFHKKILGGLFTMVGMIIGAGAPAKR